MVDDDDYQDVEGSWFRIPEDYQGATVLVLGGGASGTDIAMELCREAKKVTVH